MSGTVDGAVRQELAASFAQDLTAADFHSNPRDPGGLNTHGMDLTSGADPMGITMLNSPSASSAIANTSKNAAGQPPTPVRRPSINPAMALLLGAPPPPPPPPPPSTPPRSKRGSAGKQRKSKSPRKSSANQSLANESNSNNSMMAVQQQEQQCFGKYSQVDDWGGSSVGDSLENILDASRGVTTETADSPSSEKSKRSTASTPTKPNLQVVAVVKSSSASIDDGIPSPPSQQRRHSVSEIESTMSVTSSQITYPFQNLNTAMPLSPNYRNVAPSLSPNYRPTESTAPFKQEDDTAGTNKKTEFPSDSSAKGTRHIISSARTTTSSSTKTSLKSTKDASPSKGSRRIISPAKKLRNRASKDVSSVDNNTEKHKSRPRYGSPIKRLRSHASKEEEVEDGSDATPRQPKRSSSPIKRLRSRASKEEYEVADTDEEEKHSKKGFFRRLFHKNKKSDHVGALALYDSRSSASGSKASTKKSATSASRQKSTTISNEKSPPEEAVIPQSSGSTENSRVVGGIPAVDEDRPEFFYAHDEVSTLTYIESSSFGSSFQQSRSRRGGDPSVTSGESGSDPVGRYWKQRDSPNPEEQARRKQLPPMPKIDPFQDPFFHQDPEGASPAVRKSHQKLVDPDLSVNVDKNHDPIGNSPMHSVWRARNRLHDPSPRGFQTPVFQEHPIQDPVGESPMHKHERGPSELRDGSPFAPDPPLYLKAFEEDGLVSEGSSVSSAEKGDNGQNLKATSKNVASYKIQSLPVLPRARIPRSPVRNEPAKETICSYSPPKKDQNSVSTLTSPKGKKYSPLNKSVSGSPRNNAKDTFSGGSQQRLISMKSSESQGSKESEAMKKAKKALTMSTAARINAKAVAYLHTLNGDPSPRSLWHRAESEDESASPTNVADKILGRGALFGTKDGETTRSSFLFSSYSKGKFKNRKFAKKPVTSSTVQKKIVVMSTKPRIVSTKDSFSAQSFSVCSGKLSNGPITNTKASPLSRQTAETCLLGPLNRDISLCSQVVSKGFAFLREKREYDIIIGISQRVTPSKEPKKSAIQPNSTLIKDFESLDPIQRAGWKLLSKAAIPIQACARRFLAQQHAVDRMWALLEIQSYVRRWRAEAYLVVSIISAVTIQAVFRGAQCRELYRAHIYSAVQIQKVVRGYLTAAHTYETVYNIILVQAQARGWVTRIRLERHILAVTAQAQSSAAIKIQTWWRARSAQMLYQVLQVDTILAQSAVRRWIARRQLASIRDARDCTAVTKIQAVWRGFQAYTDYIFCLVDIMLVQRSVRVWLAKKELRHIRCQRAALRIQTEWRCYSNYTSYIFARSAIQIQKTWRSYSAQTSYIFVLADIIRIQCAVRSWSARKFVRAEMMRRAALDIQKQWRCYSAFSEYKMYRAAVMVQKQWRRFSALTDYKIYTVAVRIQKQWRCYSAMTDYKLYRSAVKIQSVWRSYSATSNYVFTLVKIAVAQQTVRSWLAKRKAMAVLIQKCWRCHSAHVLILRELASILLCQAVARRYFARKCFERKCIEYQRYVEYASAAKLQAAWRGFWQYSHFIILRYEVVRIQSLVRRNLFQRDYNLQLGCCILIQSAARRYLAVRKLRNLQIPRAVILAKAGEMRERLACSHIQFWWRIVLECRKEKKAAMVIERFFLMIKAEIEREIRRCERKQHTKRQQRRRTKREPDDKLLERAWLNSIDSNDTGALSASPGVRTLHTPSSSFSSPTISTPTRQRSPRRSFGHRASSPSMDLVMRHEFESSGLRDTGISSPKRRAKALAKVRSKLPNERTEKVSLNEAYLDAEISHDKERKKAANRYLKKYGIKTAPNRSTRSGRFFADDAGTLETSLEANESTILAARSALRRSKYTMTSVRPATCRSMSSSEPTTPLDRSPRRTPAVRVSSPGRTLQSTSFEITATRSMSSSHDARGSPTEVVRRKEYNEMSRQRSKNATSPSKKSQQPPLSPSKRPSPRYSHAARHQSPRHSPRHGKILVMNPYPDYPVKKEAREDKDETEYYGEEFGMI